MTTLFYKEVVLKQPLEGSGETIWVALESGAPNLVHTIRTRSLARPPYKGRRLAVRYFWNEMRNCVDVQETVIPMLRYNVKTSDGISADVVSTSALEAAADLAYRLTRIERVKFTGSSATCFQYVDEHERIYIVTRPEEN